MNTNELEMDIGDDGDGIKNKKERKE